MDAEIVGGMFLVAAVFVIMVVLVIVSRSRIERFHRDGPRSHEPRVSRERHG